ncbi:MAG: restriction endonuclease [Micropruina sp.]|nr:restriction endonuclease [Micropruina sp.]
MSGEDRERVLAAVNFWFTAKQEQLQAVLDEGRSQGGTRDAVVGGKHLDGLNTLMVDQLKRLGVPGLTFRTNAQATLPGYYRVSKAWDLLVLQFGEPILAVEYKSMKGSEGKNLNNRMDEVLGVGEDLREAQRHGLVSPRLKRAYVFIMEASPAVLAPVGLRGVVGSADEAFRDSTYLDRMTLLCERIRESGLYNLTWAIAATTDPIDFYEPSSAVGWARFNRDLINAFA